MRRALLTLALLLASPVAAVVVTGPSADQTLRVAEPLTLAFTVHNDGGTELKGTPSLELPGGWQAVLPPEEVVLAPGEDALVLVTLAAPTGALAGTHGVRLSFQGGQVSTTVRVPEHHALSLMAQPGELLALGGEVETGFVLRNNGNVPESLSLTTSTAGLRVNPPGVSLAPGQQTTITVAGQLPPGREPGRRITLKAAGQGGLVAAASVTRLALVKELPLSERALTLRGGLAFPSAPGRSPELTLSGQLAPGLPGRFQLSASTDALRASYQDEHRTFGVGNLLFRGVATQPDVPLLGLSASVRVGEWGVSGAAGEDAGGFAGGAGLEYLTGA
ncbi:MAG: COG1470 family protein, partial [Deinococcus sp.]